MINFGSSLRVGALKGDMEITGKEKQVPPVFSSESTYKKCLREE